MFGTVLVFSLLDEVSFNFLQIRGKSRWFLYGYEIFGVKNRKRRDKKDYTKRETDFYAIKWQSSFLAAHYKYILKILRTTA
jgi:pullulanase/glycogen debranching enzyme